MTTEAMPSLIVPGPKPVPTVATMQQGPVMPWRDDEEEYEYAVDARTFLLDRCQLWLPSCHLMRDLICCATYYLPGFDVLPGGHKVFRAQKSQEEAQWQGKVGLVIAKGPLAFVDAPQRGLFFHGDNVEIGEWVQWDIHDARQCTIGRMHCRYLKDVQIIAKWDDPRLVY